MAKTSKCYLNRREYLPKQFYNNIVRYNNIVVEIKKQILRWVIIDVCYVIAAQNIICIFVDTRKQRCIAPVIYHMVYIGNEVCSCSKERTGFQSNPIILIQITTTNWSKNIKLVPTCDNKSILGRRLTPSVSPQLDRKKHKFNSLQNRLENQSLPPSADIKT